MKQQTTLTKRIAIFFLIALAHFFLARLSLLAFYGKLFESVSFGDKLFAFVEGVRFDLSSITYAFLIPLLFLTFPAKFARHKIWQHLFGWPLYLIMITGVGFLIGDVVYFDFVKRHISYELFVMGGDDVNVMGDMIFGGFLPFVLLFLADAIFLLFVWFRLLRIPLTEPPRWLQKLSVFSIITRVGVYLGILILAVIAGRGGVGDKTLTIVDAYAKGDSNYGNLVLNGIFSMSQSALKSSDHKHKYFDSKEAFDHLYPGENLAEKEYPLVKQSGGPNQGKYNMVFVLVESLSAKYVGSFAEKDLGLTPNIDAIAAKGMKFTNFYASGQRSVEGIQATLTGIPPIIGMPTIAIGLVANHSKIGKLAADNGYRTIFTESLKRRSFRVDSIAGANGFQEFYAMEDMKIRLDYPDPTEAKFGWDYETYMTAFDKMKAAKKPFFSYILTSSTHTPYPRPPKHLQKYPHDKNKEEGFLNTLYYHDWSFGEFMKKAKKEPWFDNTIFIFTADHALAHYQSGTFKARFHIPLIIYAPKLVKPAVIDTPASQLDVFPTMIEMLDLKGEYSTLGKSLMNTSDDDVAYVREGSIMGIIGKKGYLRHSLSNRLETKALEEGVSPGYFHRLEKKLLSMDQITFELIQSNRWAK